MGIAPPPMGLQECFGLKRESTFGSAQNPDTWFKVSSNTLERADPRLVTRGPSGGMARHRYNSTKPKTYRSTPAIEGNVMVDGDYDDIGHIFTAAFGNPTFQTNTPVSGAHTHTWTLSALKPAATPDGYTLARLTGLEDLRFIGSKLDNLQLSATPGAESILGVGMDWICQQGGNTEVDDDETGGYSTAPWIEFHDWALRYHATPNTATAGLATLASGSESSQFSLRHENRFRKEPGIGNGIRGIREPTWNDFPLTVLSATRDFFDDEFFDKYYSDTDASAFCTIEAKATSTTMVTGSTPYSLRLYMGMGLITRSQTFGGGAGPLPENLTFEAAHDGTNPILTVVLVNGTNATYGS